jgi:hypothetical protein
MIRAGFRDMRRRGGRGGPAATHLAAALLAALLGGGGARAQDTPAAAPAAPTASAGVMRLPGIVIDPAARRVEVEASFQIVEEVFLEYLAVGEGGKAHESLFIAHCSAENLELGLIMLGLKEEPQVHFQGEAVALAGPRVAIEARWTQDGAERSARVEDLLSDARFGKPMERVGFAFTGSRFQKRPAPRHAQPAAGPAEVLAAAASGSFIAVYHDPDAILDNPLVSGGDFPLLVPTFGMLEVAAWVPGDERIRPIKALLPPRGTRAVLVIRPLGPAEPAK